MTDRLRVEGYEFGDAGSEWKADDPAPKHPNLTFNKGAVNMTAPYLSREDADAYYRDLERQAIAAEREMEANRIANFKRVHVHFWRPLEFKIEHDTFATSSGPLHAQLHLPIPAWLGRAIWWMLKRSRANASTFRTGR